MRRRRLESDAASWKQRLSVGGTVLFAAKKIRIGRVIVAATSFRRRAILLAGTIALHRFSISSPDLRIDAAKRSKQGQSVHRFSISSPDLRIDAAKRSKQGQSVHRFLISSPDFRIDVAPGLILGISLQFKGRSIVPRPGNAGWAGTSDGVAARGFVNGEGPAAQRWEGKHRRCAPVRSPCPQADSAAETAQTPQADSDSGTRPSPRRVRKSYWTD